jgi:broad specificity phosphatase PhoE
MPADRIHLIRHGEVHNPGGVLYGRLPHFRLSDLGHEMAKSAASKVAEAVGAEGRKVVKLLASPLLRTQESAAPVASAFGLDVHTDERLIEPYNIFEGRKLSASHILIRPHLYYHLRNPQKPSWGEPYEAIAARMMSAIEAWNSVASGDVVIVSHQLPIVMVQLTVAGKPLAHNPKQRRCSLSSITTLERSGDTFVEVGYVDTAANHTVIDRGAV